MQRESFIPAPDHSLLPPDGGPQFNRLIFASSPYLLQHARNPVDWHQWGDEAFDKAKAEDKPIFLSIGYSTCHWCHVMEHESFMDERTAEFLSEHFVSIKVDREERPDVDHIYMTVCQAMTGSGGWPLSVFMTPDKAPFYSGTYFPRDDRYGRPGFLRILNALNHTWRNERHKIRDVAEEILSGLQADGGEAADVPPSVLEQAELGFARSYDPVNGGFGRAPKFPMAHVLSFLLLRSARGGRAENLRMTEHTLTSMRRGGIFDHLGSGFCRYSTDEHWLIPHFEKMLYDNALLLTAYADAYRHTRNPHFADVSREIVEYIIRYMTSPEGVFHSAENADSEGAEGKFYVFTDEEFRLILGEDAGVMAEYFGVTAEGNFEHGTNALYIAVDEKEWSERHGFTPETAGHRIEAARGKLFEARAKRVHPSLDDKVLASWNGLMIAALARAGQALGEHSLIERASRAADFILENMRAADGGLLRRWRNGEAGIGGFLEDYAFMIWGLTELYESSFDVLRLEQAVELCDRMLADFSDEKNGGLCFTANGAEKLIARSKDCYDGAIPSGNSVAAYLLARLAAMTGKRDYENRARDIISAFGKQIMSHPTGHALMLTALDFLSGPSREIVIAAANAADAKPMVDLLRSRLLPGTVLLVKESGARGDRLSDLAPFTAGHTPINGRATAYVCENFSCKAPVTTAEELALLLV